MEPNLTKLAFVTNWLRKWLDTLRTELHDSGRMHKATPHDRNLPSMGESEIAGSEADQPHLKFVVNYREGAKPKQKVFEKEEEAIQFARARNPHFRRDPIQYLEGQTSSRM